jgi:hypothetical protein
MRMIVSLATVLALLAETDTKVKLSGACPRVAVQSVEKQMAVELARMDILPTTVALSCDGESAALVATTAVREVRSRLNLKEVVDVAVARTLALAAVELVLEAQNPPEVAVRIAPPDTESRVLAVAQPARFWIRAGGGVESGVPFLGAVQLSADVRLWRWLWMSGGFGYQRARATFQSGAVQADAMDGTLIAQAVAEVGRFAFLGGVGARIGNIWLRGDPNASVDGGQLQSVRYGPLLKAGFHVWPLSWLSLGIDVQGGWHLRSVIGLIEGEPQVSYRSGWVRATAELGVRF